MPNREFSRIVMKYPVILRQIRFSNRGNLQTQCGLMVNIDSVYVGNLRTCVANGH